MVELLALGGACSKCCGDAVNASVASAEGDKEKDKAIQKYYEERLKYFNKSETVTNKSTAADSLTKGYTGDTCTKDILSGDGSMTIGKFNTELKAKCKNSNSCVSSYSSTNFMAKDLYSFAFGFGSDAMAGDHCVFDITLPAKYKGGLEFEISGSENANSFVSYTSGDNGDSFTLNQKNLSDMTKAEGGKLVFPR